MTVEFDPGEYARWFESELGRVVWADERRALDRLLGSVRERRILDAGAGEGRFAAELAGRGAAVVGVDRSSGMLAAAKRRLLAGGPRVLLTRGDVHRLPFRSASFDDVVAITLLCFAERPGNVTREMARVTRPGGRVVLAELGRWSPWAALRRVRGWFGDDLWRSSRFWTEAELRVVLARAGLEPGRTTAAVYYPPILPLARLLRPLETRLQARTSPGAAFIAVEGWKPRSGPTRTSRKPSA